MDIELSKFCATIENKFYASLQCPVKKEDFIIYNSCSTITRHLLMAKKIINNMK